MKLEMYEHKYPGKLITFCGLDGSGKTTQILLLQQYLRQRGVKVFITKQPTTAVRQSEIFRTFIDGQKHEAYDYRALTLLCASDRVQHSNKEIAKKLEEGYIVISDRYFYSCVVNFIASGYEGETWIYDVAKYVPKPDIAVFLDLPVEKAIERIRSRHDERNRYIDKDFQRILRNTYLDVANENDCLLVSTIIDVQETFKYIVDRIESAFGGVISQNDQPKDKSMQERINTKIRQLCYADEISETMLLNENLGFDSLRLVELMVELEELLGITLNEGDLDPSRIRTVADIHTLLEKYEFDNN